MWGIAWARIKGRGAREDRPREVLPLGLECPHCDRLHPTCTAAIEGQKGRPRAGDLSLCSHCGELSIFDVRGGALSLRRMTAGEERGLVGLASREEMGGAN